MTNLTPGLHNFSSLELKEELRILRSRIGYYVLLQVEEWYKGEVENLNNKIKILEQQRLQLHLHSLESVEMERKLKTKQTEILLELENRTKETARSYQRVKREKELKLTAVEKILKNLPTEAKLKIEKESGKSVEEFFQTILGENATV